MEEKTYTNLADYSYSRDTQTQISGNLVDALIGVLQEVELQETRNSFLTMTPTAIKKGELSWNKIPNPEEFFMQEPQQTMSLLGAQVLDLRFLLLNIKNDDVKSGVSKLTSEIGAFQTKKDEELKLS